MLFDVVILTMCLYDVVHAKVKVENIVSALYRLWWLVHWRAYPRAQLHAHVPEQPVFLVHRGGQSTAQSGLRDQSRRVPAALTRDRG